mmetsp:Transcript_28188/g.50986  ORF Transcript_28188/g.50986 Transcript_28188/m.50986 type:complete len:656 (-) Transcript_28188:61-2028(-)|eukprot:CAMPEP_0201869962 /NCGR_PEP_ID=MMETSP0902-20130614/3268_1 /ASSEMBLY_ACC=CAM_ASM_000551 /TAXON_ID=420261 /ORGANISM="Thalassiosira antarctica, Strain CCMP982" /LENGTH=655 /DNA_ID=CAMNT_0048395531 /DNA_START=14 /DNA_END=1981 /DNA_ORIENTATION=-
MRTAAAAAPSMRSMNNKIASLARRRAITASSATSTSISPTKMAAGVSSLAPTTRPQHLRSRPILFVAPTDGGATPAMSPPRYCRWLSSSAARPSKDSINGNGESSSSSSWPQPQQQPPSSSSSINNSSTADTPLRTNKTPPVTTTTNTAQVYESRYVNAEIGFNIHDGPVPINQTARAAKARLKAKDRTNKNGNNLMDPFYVPKQEGQTHLIQGGTPCDILPNAPSYRLADYGEESVYTLILLRHGESEWNALNQYTGWCDVNLTKRGEGEARAAGRLLAENGIEIDHAFTSVLKRASFTTNMCLNMAGQQWVPVTKTWRLNERHYGALQGYNKDTAYEELNIDQELVMEMRRSYATPPPRMADDHPYWHGNDRRYSKLTDEQLERSRAESLEGAAERIMPFFNSVIATSLREGNRCLVVSHANTIRTLIKQIDNISDQDIKQLSIPTGIPLIYRLDRNLKPVDPNCELEFRYMVQPKGYTWATSRQHGFHGVYLGDLERLQDIQKKRDATSRQWQRMILRNIAKQVNEEDVEHDDECFHNPHFHGENIVETKHLWWKITKKMQHPEFANMLLLVRMKEYLESLLSYRRSRKTKTYRYIPLETYEKMVEQVHLDSAGEVVDPFVSLEDRADREFRQRRWIKSLNEDKEDSHSLIN